MWFWVRRLLGQKPPYFDKFGGDYRNAEKVLDAMFGLKMLMDEKESRTIIYPSPKTNGNSGNPDD